ncbi:ATP-binding protein [Clostridium sardiniense]|uniref:ATP-binding protein n=1 Tax=Clostridium sardiniense TaxID=29369 RepID=UPI001959F4AF|nr:ATP-binding protein [Clostridium sardiniense]MBM7835028.1 signal transduction histidine kinase [Clostridium sardiniense]
MRMKCMNSKLCNNRLTYSLNGAIAILLILLIIYYITGSYPMFYNMLNVSCASFGISLAVIAIIRKSSNYYNYIGIGFLFIGLIEFSQVFISKFGIHILENMGLYITFTISEILGILILPVSFILMKHKVDNKKSIITYFVITIISSILGIFLYDLREIDESSVFITVLLVQFILIILLIILLNRIRKKYKEIKYKYIFLYFILMNMYHLLLKISYIYTCNFAFEAYVVKYVAYFSIYEGITSNILSLMYTQMKENLLKVKKKQSELNLKLNQRNVILNELNTINIKSEKRYYDLIESFKDGIITFNMGKITYVNNEAVDMLGFRYKGELLGRDFDYVLDNLIEKESIDSSLILEGSDVRLFGNNLEKLYRFNSKSNNLKELELYLVKNREKREIVYIRDITDNNVYNKIRERYEDFVRQEDIKNEFYSNISHELRTPINVINSALTLNEIYLKDNNINSVSKNNDIIRQNCLRLIRTINNFIDANKISEGYLKPNKKIYNIVEVVEGVSIATSKYAKKINNSIIFDSEESEIYLPVDRDMIERVILNLLSNSVKHGERNRNIKINMYSKKNYLYIIVKNYTKIIDEEEKKYIFDQFTKLNKSLNRQKEGSGLGLFLSKTIIELHDGSIEFESEKAQGNKFIIKLPIVEDIRGYEPGESVEIVTLDKKVDVEFADIYI